MLSSLTPVAPPGGGQDHSRSKQMAFRFTFLTGISNSVYEEDQRRFIVGVRRRSSIRCSV